MEGANKNVPFFESSQEVVFINSHVHCYWPIL